MKTKHLFYLALSVLLFVACEKAVDERKGNELKIQKELFGGYAQKGPFVSGSSVTISELKPNLDQSGRTYFTTITDNLGSFEKKNIELISNYVELKVDGYYFNEIWGNTSAGQMTLYALVDVKDVNSANVNVLTHLEKPRVEYLVTQKGMSFAEAKQQAQREVLAIFGFEPSGVSSDALNLIDNAALLAISCILQGYLSTGDMMELMAKIGADIKTDGKLDNATLCSQLVNNANSFSLPVVRANLEQKYSELGVSVTIPNFEDHVQQFIEKNLYQQTELITYPERGEYGKNILCLTEDTLEINNEIYYSLKAEIPQGMSLKVVLRGLYFGNVVTPMQFWSLLKNDVMTLEVAENGKPNDIFINFGDQDDTNRHFIVEYYENGATTPTRIKEMVVKNTNPTPLITYSATGMFGDNLLSDNVTSVKRNTEYGLKADVPEGLSLKIVLKSGYIDYGMMHPAIPLINWHTVQKENKYEEKCFTFSYLENELSIVQSGKTGDLMITIDEYRGECNNIPYLTIEYYENGSTTPTKVKTLNVE